MGRPQVPGLSVSGPWDGRGSLSVRRRRRAELYVRSKVEGVAGHTFYRLPRRIHGPTVVPAPPRRRPAHIVEACQRLNCNRRSATPTFNRSPWLLADDDKPKDSS